MSDVLKHTDGFVTQRFTKDGELVSQKFTASNNETEWDYADQPTDQPEPQDFYASYDMKQPMSPADVLGDVFRFLMDAKLEGKEIQGKLLDELEQVYNEVREIYPEKDKRYLFTVHVTGSGLNAEAAWKDLGLDILSFDDVRELESEEEGN